MKVKLLVCQVGHKLVRDAGTVIDVPEAEAMRLIQKQAAVPVAEAHAKPSNGKTAAAPSAETPGAPARTADDTKARKAQKRLRKK